MKYYLVTRFGGIPLNRLVNTIGHKGCTIKLHSVECSRRHASIIFLRDNSLKIRNESRSNYIYVNDVKLLPNDSLILVPGDVLSFAGEETFKLYCGDIILDLTASL